MLAGLASPAPLQAERVHLVVHGFAPGHDLPGTHLGAGSVVELHPCTGRRRRSGERLGKRLDLTGYFSSPPREVRGDLERDRDELEAARFSVILHEAPVPRA
jgi:hypothetical protein